jgi:hypothetical protein
LFDDMVDGICLGCGVVAMKGGCWCDGGGE